MISYDFNTTGGYTGWSVRKESLLLMLMCVPHSAVATR